MSPAVLLKSALLLVPFFCATAADALAQVGAVDDCPLVTKSREQLVLQCGADDDPITLALPHLASGSYDGMLTQGNHTTTLVWIGQLGGVTDSPVWRYLTADGASACQLDGRPSPSGNISRSCIALGDF
jgi:hypothetical protein